jgi:ribosomal protein L44E
MLDLTVKPRLKNFSDFGEEYKTEWSDEKDNKFVFVCFECDWCDTRPIGLAWEDENCQKWLMTYCPLCGCHVDPSFVN